MAIDSVALTVTFPPCPAPEVLVLMSEPPVNVSCPTWTSMLPALPVPLVLAFMVPPCIVTRGALTIILPAAPAPISIPSVVAKMLLRRPVGEVPDRVSVSVAVTVTLPPVPGPKVLLVI
jgi:hypothetical protein